MAGGLDDLNFEIKLALHKAMTDLRAFGNLLSGQYKLIESINTQFDRLAGSAAMGTEELHRLGLRLDPISNNLDKVAKQHEVLSEKFTRNLMATAIEGTTSQIKLLGYTAAVSTQQMLGLASASQSVRAPDARRAGGGNSGGGGANFVRVAGVAGQLAVMNRVNATLKGVSTTLTTVSRTSNITASAMDRFRMGLQAVQVNPALNVVKNSFDGLGAAAAKGIDTLRGVADAILSDLPGAASAAVGAMGSVGTSLDSVSNTASKHISRLHEVQGSLTILSNVFPFAAENIARFRAPLDAVTATAEAAANKFDAMKADFGAAASKIRGDAYVLTGVWKELGGSADIFARSQYYALLPSRLLKREVEGGIRIFRVARGAYHLLTGPIHAVALALGQSRAEWKDLRSRLPPLTGGLQLATRATRLFVQSAYIVGTTVGSVAKLFGGLSTAVSVSRRAFSVLSSPVKAATASVTGMSRALTSVASASAKATGGMSGVLNKANMMKTAAAGLAAGAIAWGGSTALAVEKNNAVFGIMLKDMGQGKAVVDSLRGSKAASLFDNAELLDSGRLLYKSGIAAQDLAGKTDQLATIAIATSTDIGDLARIYQQGASVGKFGQDKINQLAERGIDIYHALESATGQSGTALQKMISDGKIGTEQMNAALSHLTEGQGIYAGSLDVMANTTTGRFQKMKNDINNALGNVMGVAISVLSPIVDALGSISESVVATFQSFAPQIMFAATAIGWFFKNYVDLAKFAFTSVSLSAVTGFNDFVYFFSDVIPAYLNWFSANWKQVFMDAGNLIVTVFANIGTNIKNAMAQIWAYIKSGGKTDLQFAFTPLLDGFKATVSQMPEIPDRAMTDLEKSLTAQTEQLGGALANDFDAMLAKAQESLSKPQEIKGGPGGSTTPGQGEGDTKNGRTSFVVDSLDRGSSAALNAIYAAQGKDKTPQKQLSEAKKQTGLLQKMANKSANKVAGKV